MVAAEASTRKLIFQLALIYQGGTPSAHLVFIRVTFPDHFFYFFFTHSHKVCAHLGVFHTPLLLFFFFLNETYRAPLK